jgi:hypothetical protein
MAQEYFTAKKPVTEESQSPALTEDDEAFLKRITSADPNAASQQVVIFDERGKASGDLAGAEQVPLPVSPPAVEEQPAKATGKQSKSKHGIKSVLTSIRSSVPLYFGKVSVKPVLSKILEG